MSNTDNLKEHEESCWKCGETDWVIEEDNDGHEQARCQRCDYVEWLGIPGEVKTRA